MSKRVKQNYRPKQASNSEAPHKNSETESSVVHTRRRLLILGGMIAVGGILGIRGLKAPIEDPATPSASPEPKPQPAPKPAPVSMPGVEQINEALDKVTENREHKRYQYSFKDLKFASDTIPENELRPYLETALKKIGGPYWKPSKPFVAEWVDKISSTFGIAPGQLTDTNITEAEKMVMISNPQSIAHELIHVFVGPEGAKWPNILHEFFAHSASPSRDTAFDPKETDHRSISYAFPQAASNIGSNPFYQMRDSTLTQLSKSLTDEKRIEICKAASKKGKIEFEELQPFLKQFGLKHAIFEPGQKGVSHRHAFLGSEKGEPSLLLVSYSADEKGEKTENSQITLIPQDDKGRAIGEPMKIRFTGAYTVKLEGFPKSTIYIPEWDQHIKIR